MVPIERSIFPQKSVQEDTAQTIIRCMTFSIKAYIGMYVKYLDTVCSHRYIEFDVERGVCQDETGQTIFYVHLLSIPPSFVAQNNPDKVGSGQANDEKVLRLSSIGESFASEILSITESIVESFLLGEKPRVSCQVSDSCWRYHANLMSQSNVSFILDADRYNRATVHL